ncbi:hypothetical protein [Endozoicomonas sp. ONNA2]|uniref:hypothetical protein n=1 Tax=Endozoicomonas sp. ONNA2 TaxID=2828741 RepID=UPI0021490CDD|nr:hypothetical protein [Endozoicomonas sp. ONNA2]
MNKLRERMNRTVGMSSRALQIFSALSQAYYYRDSPKAAAKILSLAGIFGKCAQYMVTRNDVLSELKKGSYSQEAEFFLELMTITSRYPAGELNIDNMLEILNERIASSGYMEEFQPDGAYIRHVNTVGRGTICQLDHVDINGADYVVKTVSPKLEECIVEDVDLLAEIIFPFMGLIEHYCKSDVELL